ncbi:MAG: Uma2 family endonuclease [Oscillospiraceae bacterium]|nr:Uma2 family endonuclease [Oscillospiraceae bacterium]
MQSNLAEKREELYTYEDYLSWEGDQRWEIIDGRAYMMASPSEVHQDISVELTAQFRAFLRGKPCKVFHAPFDVRLFPGSTKKHEKALVQPDLLVVCDPSKLDGSRVNGAPDLVVEILSPSNQRYERLIKFQKYFQAGVREYWVVDPVEKLVQVFLLEEKRYFVMAYGATDVLPCTVLPGLEIPLRDIFSDTSAIITEE